MKLNKIIQNEEPIDIILKEAAEGYGDLIAAALIHRVSLKSLQARVIELRDLRITWIS
ncbi:Uncharacterised protein [uncultured archaeon]|nr:Uncharacterised protein [uncultured archaeon]